MHGETASLISELAFIMPVFATLFLGLLELGLFQLRYPILIEAAKVGAHTASVINNPELGNPQRIETICHETKQVVDSYLVNRGLSANVAQLVVEGKELDPLYLLPSSPSLYTVEVTLKPTSLLQSPLSELFISPKQVSVIFVSQTQIEAIKGKCS